MRDLYTCNQCLTLLTADHSELNCKKCRKQIAKLEDNFALFNEVPEINGYFEKHMERVGPFYENYSRKDYLASLHKKDLWEMDTPNKMIGVTEKFWWEKPLGQFKNKNILDLGCGITYMPLYWANTENNVVGIDISKAEVKILKNVMDSIQTPKERFSLAVADARKIEFNKKFDIIHLANTLHHIEDKETIMKRAREWLDDDGKLLIVEANYYYPPRWIVETDVINPNPIKERFLAADKIEEGERGITYAELKKLLKKNGFKIEYNTKDINYIGYVVKHWLRSETLTTWTVFQLDKWILSKIVPNLFTPFEYIVASKD